MQLTDGWITGFVDGDGCFYVSHKTTKTNKHRVAFIVSQSEESIDVLEALKTKFKCGFVHKAGGGGKMYEYRVGSEKDLNEIIVPFFLKNPLQTTKRESFKKFYKALQENAGLLSLNQNLDTEAAKTNEMKAEVPFQYNLTRDWLTGFIDAEGNFYTSMTENYPRPQFSIGLKESEESILLAIKEFLGCGSVYKKKPKTVGPHFSFLLSSQPAFEAIFKICITGTNRCLLKTAKRHDFVKFYKIVQIIKSGKHLTEAGIEEIHKLIDKKPKKKS